MFKMEKFATNFVKNTVGMIDGLPRIYNVDRASYTLGHTEVNTQATSPFSRTKTHKAWFVGPTDIVEGDLVQDRGDGKHYLVMSLKKEILNGESVYLDGTLYYANATCTIQRFTGGAKDAFGRDTDPAPTTVASNVYVMVNPQVIDVLEQRDRPIAKDKIKIVVQSKFGVKDQDRLVTSLGDTWKVINIDKSSLDNLWILYADGDTR